MEVSIYLGEQKYKALEELAREDESTVTGLIYKLVENYLISQDPYRSNSIEMWQSRKKIPKRESE